MPLTGPQIGRIHKAILAAYSRKDLTRVLLTCMDVDFDQVVEPDDFSAQVFALVRWANQRERALELLKYAHEENRTNAGLADLYAEAQTWGAPIPATPTATPPQPADLGVPAAPSTTPPAPPKSYRTDIEQSARIEAPPPAPAKKQPIEFDWITIPAGEFVMGSDKTHDVLSFDKELPQHRVFLPEYCIARFPVSNAQYLAFIKATGYRTPVSWENGKIPSGKEHHPVVTVSWHDAHVFCVWASDAIGHVVRLPTEAEWEKAARGADGRLWPWGNSWPTEERCNFNQNVNDTTSVDAYMQGASPYGALDMAGNVWEWTGSAFRPYPYVPGDGREDQQSSESRAIRGGSFLDGSNRVRCASRSSDGPEWANMHNRGFRVVQPILTTPESPKREPEIVRQPPRVEPRPAPTSKPPIEWVNIPAGEFLMGSDKARDEQAWDDELPQHRVGLPEYRIARVPVTNEQYLAFVQATGHRAPHHWWDGRIPQGKERHPVVRVSWHDARAFCAWASEVTGATVRLPGEAEWEKAARGTDGRIWPWGDDPPTQERCNFGNNVRDTTPVDAYPRGASPYGVLDMAGNVWEWTGSLYKPYPYDAADGREDLEAGGRRTLRGGGFINSDDFVRCAVRRGYYPVHWEINPFGFRVMSPGF